MIRKLSLRARLLGVAALITIVATVVADFVVYAELRSYLYGQVDQTLEASHRAVETTADAANRSDPRARRDKQQRRGQRRTHDFCSVGFETAPGMFIEVRTKSGAVVTGASGREYCPSFQPGASSAMPKLPKTITGFRPSSQNRAEPVTYFTRPLDVWDASRHFESAPRS